MQAALRARKEALEEALRRRREDLRRVCLQEGELTGVLPPETPLVPGETPPVFRRRVGTAFCLNVKDDGTDQLSTALSKLELEVELQGQITSAAQRLAGDKTVGKNVRKQRKLAYTRAHGKLKEMEKKLADMRRQAGKPAAGHHRQPYQGTYHAPSSSSHPHTNIDHLLVQLVHEPGLPGRHLCQISEKPTASPLIEPGNLQLLDSAEGSSPGVQDHHTGCSSQTEAGVPQHPLPPPAGGHSDPLTLHPPPLWPGRDLGSCGTSLASCDSAEEPPGLGDKALSTDTGFPDDDSPDSRSTSHSSLALTPDLHSGLSRSDSPGVVKRRDSAARGALRKKPEKSFSYYFDEDNSPNSQSSGVNKKHFVVSRAGDNSRLQELYREAAAFGGCQGVAGGGRVVGLAMGEDDDLIDEGSYDMDDDFRYEDDGDSDFDEDAAMRDMITEVPTRKKTFFLSKGLKKAVLLSGSKRDSIIDRGYHALEKLFMSDPVSPPMARSVRRHRDIVQRHSIYRPEGETINLSPNPSPKPVRSPKSLSPRFGSLRPTSPIVYNSELGSPDLRYADARSLAHSFHSEGRPYKMALSEPSSPNLRAPESRSPKLRPSEPRSPQLSKSEHRYSRYAGSDFKNGYEVTVRGQSASSPKNSEELNAKIKELIEDSKNLKPIGRSRSVDYTTDLKVNNNNEDPKQVNDDLKLSKSQIRQKSSSSSSSPSFRRSFMLFTKRKGKNKQMKHSASESQGLGQAGATSPPAARLPPTGRRPPQEVTRFDGDYVKFSLSGSTSGSSEDLSSALMEHYDLRCQDLNLQTIRPPPAAFKDSSETESVVLSSTGDCHTPDTHISMDSHSAIPSDNNVSKDCNAIKPEVGFPEDIKPKGNRPKSRHLYANDPELPDIQLQCDLQRKKNVPPEPPDKTPKFPLVLPEDLDFSPSNSSSWPRRSSQDPNSFAQSDHIGYKTVGVYHPQCSSNSPYGINLNVSQDNQHLVKNRGVHIHNVKRRAKTGSMLVGSSHAPKAGFEDCNDSKDSFAGKDLSINRRTSWHSQHNGNITSESNNTSSGNPNSVRYFETIV